ncbi:kynureninase [Herbiconiux sp. CPCC 205763]|uniref:Kynureninase n=1 Tax=Herbiconiux aconitum TaxID=2970913 RepID=A0ABT2GRE6_9MICO|nr:kynureninase [Herbiconiux aconitum]MCS5718743.1 kynureninase [Herbiconiux aconitum]
MTHPTTPAAASSAERAAEPGTAAAPTTAELDRLDPLAGYRERFLPSDGLVAYLDGNSLGRPLRVTADHLGAFVARDWGGRLIRAWDEQWMELPFSLGDRIAAATLGAAPGQTVVADSTTVLLYKLMRAAVDARPGRHELVLDDDNFPTDRFVAEGIARERGLRIRWISVDPARGVELDQVRAAVGPDTALVVLSHVSYRSGFLADMEGITRVAHDAGALVLWDLCHSVGSVPTRLDEWNVDLAVGCTYKYLNGGPGSPAFGYVARRLQADLEQPVQGWMGAADVFAMGDGFVPGEGMRRFLSGTPPVIGMLAMQDMLDLIEEAGIDAIRAKSIALTEHALRLVEKQLVPLGVTIATPKAAEERGSHVTIRHPEFREVTARLWEQGVIPDFRAPDGLRIGLSPLSTSFAELQRGIDAIETALTGGATAAGSS